MAGQNIPGFAVLELNDYETKRQPLLRQTGYASLLISPFGGVPVNMSAITAAMMSGEDAHPNPQRRYWAAIVSGISYVVLAFAAGSITRFASAAPPELITALAGLALIPALVAAFKGAFANAKQLEAPALTFLLSASGMTLFGVSGAFWGLAVGAVVWGVKGVTANRDQAP
jgi:benzoate membrane transport protein